MHIANVPFVFLELAEITRSGRLPQPEQWLTDRRSRMEIGLKRLAHAALTGTIPGGSIENGVLHIDRLSANRKSLRISDAV
jgi:hypothetical protein